jgi:hypothetical protein
MLGRIEATAQRKDVATAPRRPTQRSNRPTQQLQQQLSANPLPVPLHKLCSDRRGNHIRDR